MIFSFFGGFGISNPFQLDNVLVKSEIFEVIYKLFTFHRLTEMTMIHNYSLLHCTKPLLFRTLQDTCYFSLASCFFITYIKPTLQF